MPRKMKKMEGMESAPSRQESVPGPSPEKKRPSRAEQAVRVQAQTSAALERAMDEDAMEEARLRARLEPMTEEQAFTAHDAAERMLKEEKKRQFLKMKGRDSLEKAQKALEPAKMRERVTRDVAIEKVNTDLLAMEPAVDVDVSMDAIEKAWAERIKRDVEKEKTPSEIAKAALEAHPEESEKLERAKAGERIRANVQAERAAAEVDPARKRAIAKLKKLEAEHDATGQQLRDLTGMSPEDAYEKLVLNGGFMQRIKRGLAKLANVPTYDLLDQWIASGKKMEEVDREVVGTEPDFGQEVKAKGLRVRADEEMETKAAIGRDDARRSRKGALDMSKPVGEVSDETLMEDVNAEKINKLNVAIEQSRVELVARADDKERKHQEMVEKYVSKKPVSVERDEDMIEAAMKRTDTRTEEEKVIQELEADWKSGTVRDAEGAVIDDEKKISAKRPMSRISRRKVSMDTGSGVVEAMAKAERVQMHQPGEEAERAPRIKKGKAEASSEESEMLKFQKERAADINVVRKEYPRAAEVWNSIATRLQGMEPGQIEALSKVFNTRDIATAYVLDRAFYDMDGDQAGKSRLDEADKLMGIEEVSPKKVRSKSVKKAA